MKRLSAPGRCRASAVFSPSIPSRGQPNGLPGRVAMTLLEVMLALALAMLVLLGLSMAIDSHLRVVDRSRRQVEQALLARSLLHRIADDIRSAVRYDPQNIRVLVPQLSTPSLEDLAAQSGLGQMDFSDIEDPEATAAQTTPPPPVPGIYGNRYELYVDLSRLPRLDQFEYELINTESSPLPDRTSDVKRVAYYVVRPEVSSLAEAAGALSQTGLIRWELDRAVSLLAAEEGTLTDLQRQVEPLAPEVLGMEFEYFDGQQWWDQWDSDALGGLPVAIRIALALAPEEVLPSTGGWWRLFSSNSPSPVEPIVYRMLVHLPAAAPIQDTSSLEALMEAQEEETSSGTRQPQQAQQAETVSPLGEGSVGSRMNFPGSIGLEGSGRRGGMFGRPGGFGPDGFGPGAEGNRPADGAPSRPGGFSPGRFGSGGQGPQRGSPPAPPSDGTGSRRPGGSFDGRSSSRQGQGGASGRGPASQGGNLPEGTSTSSKRSR